MCIEKNRKIFDLNRRSFHVVFVDSEFHPSLEVYKEVWCLDFDFSYVSFHIKLADNILKLESLHQTG